MRGKSVDWIESGKRHAGKRTAWSQPLQATNCQQLEVAGGREDRLSKEIAGGCEDWLRLKIAGRCEDCLSKEIAGGREDWLQLKIAGRCEDQL